MAKALIGEPQALMYKVRAVLLVVHTVFAKAGFQLNLKLGKTAVLLILRGKGSTAMRKYLATSAPQRPFLWFQPGERVLHNIQRLVKSIGSKRLVTVSASPAAP